MKRSVVRFLALALALLTLALPLTLASCDSDDGGEKERFAAARQKYFDTYGEDFMGADPNTPWTDTYPR